MQRIAQMLSDKLAEDIVILDMREVVSYTDWFVIASRTSESRFTAPC